MKKYFFLPLALLASAVLFLQIPNFINQKVTAAPGDTNIQVFCDKQSPNNVGNNNNGYHSKDNKYHAFCGHQEEACVSSSGNVVHSDLNQTSCSGAAAKNGCPPPTHTNYVGVACKTDVTCTCGNIVNGKFTTAKDSQGQWHDVHCSNGLTGQKQDDACLGARVCLEGSVQVHDAWNQTIHGADCQQNCKCDHPGQTGNGKNGWTCADKSKSSACSNKEDYCRQNANSPGGVECVNSASCTCSSDKTKINCVSKGPNDPKNAPPTSQHTFDCNGPTCVSGPNVDQPDFSYANQHITGIKCNNPTGPTQLPDPPSPPCQHWDSKGVCQTFGSAFGGFSTDPQGFVQKIFAILLSVSGGIALLLIIKAGYQLMTAQGNPEKLNNAREQLVAAIVGLVFLIFSFVFLELIGFDILHIPGFNSGPQTANNTAVCSPGSCIQTSLCTAKNPGHCNSNGCPSGQSCIQ